MKDSAPAANLTFLDDPLNAHIRADCFQVLQQLAHACDNQQITTSLSLLCRILATPCIMKALNCQVTYAWGSCAQPPAQKLGFLSATETVQPFCLPARARSSSLSKKLDNSFLDCCYAKAVSRTPAKRCCQIFCGSRRKYCGPPARTLSYCSLSIAADVEGDGPPRLEAGFLQKI